MADNPTRPVLRYYGGKWRLAPWIISHFPAHRVYVEPFGGSASVLLRKQRSYAEVYNDLDGEIVNLFRVLRNPAQARELERLLRLTPYAREEQDSAYLPASDQIEQARRTIIKGFMTIGSDNIKRHSGFRSYTGPDRHVPAREWTTYPELIPRFCKRPENVIIENRPAIEVMQQHDTIDTLHYVDPPYIVATRSEDVDRYRHELTNADHRELAAFLRTLKGTVILSGYPCDLYDQELYPDWRRTERQALAAGARDRTEVLWINRGIDLGPLFGGVA